MQSAAGRASPSTKSSSARDPQSRMTGGEPVRQLPQAPADRDRVDVGALETADSRRQARDHAPCIAAEGRLQERARAVRRPPVHHLLASSAPASAGPSSPLAARTIPRRARPFPLRRHTCLIPAYGGLSGAELQDRRGAAGRVRPRPACTPPPSAGASFEVLSAVPTPNPSTGRTRPGASPQSCASSRSPLAKMPVPAGLRRRGSARTSRLSWADVPAVEPDGTRTQAGARRCVWRLRSVSYGVDEQARHGRRTATHTARNASTSSSNIMTHE